MPPTPTESWRRLERAHQQGARGPFLGEHHESRRGARAVFVGRGSITQAIRGRAEHVGIVLVHGLPTCACAAADCAKTLHMCILVHTRYCNVCSMLQYNTQS